MKPCKLCQVDMEEGSWDYCEKCRTEWKRPRERYYYLKKRQSDESRKASTERAKKWNEEHYEHYQQLATARRIKLQHETLSFYGNSDNPKCVKCGETNINVLSLDHINNNGKQDPDRLNSMKVYRKALALKDRTQYQTLCYNCNWKKHLANLQSKWKYEKANINQRSAKQRRKIKCISHYSQSINQCCKCGNNDMEVLCLDHINNDGNVHRKQLNNGINTTAGTGLYQWAIKNNFPPILQVLCFNCNILKHRVYTRAKHRLNGVLE